MKRCVDLHCHSTASDGLMPPREVVRLAKAKDIGAMSLTDHDTIAGVAEAADECRLVGIDFIPGIELSCEFPRPGTLHLLGYGVDPASYTLSRYTVQLNEARAVRNEKILGRLTELGYPIEMSELKQVATGTVGRPHIAELLVRKGYAKNWSEAFNKFIGINGIAYFCKEAFNARHAIDLVHQAGGLVFLAHAIQLRQPNFAALETVIKNLVDDGLDGVEVLHSDHDEMYSSQVASIADRFKLLKSGGSDFHGRGKDNVKFGFAAGRRIPREFFDAIVERLVKVGKLTALS